MDSSLEKEKEEIDNTQDSITLSFLHLIWQYTYIPQKVARTPAHLEK